MKKILISAGPIPARLDSVKYITNRFRGRLMLKVAHQLVMWGFDVTLVKWRYTDLNFSGPVINVDDVKDYYNKVLDIKADTYILGAAVANIMPSNPWAEKFPSHKYNVGDKFNVEFEISPRLIDAIKSKYPRSTLIGYKLFDGTHEELYQAALKVIDESKANVVFANTPSKAKTTKYAIMPDGVSIEMDFDEHMKFIDRAILAKHYRTEIADPYVWDGHLNFGDLNKLIETYPSTAKYGKTYGCFAVRCGDRFFTTSRGHRTDRLAVVDDVDYKNRIVKADIKATLNAPLLHTIFRCNPDINIILHNHKAIGIEKEYVMPGTEEEVLAFEGVDMPSGQAYYIEHHGYVVGFETYEQCFDWIEQEALR